MLTLYTMYFYGKIPNLMRFCLNILANCSNSSKSVDSSGGKSNLGGCPYCKKNYLVFFRKLRRYFLLGLNPLLKGPNKLRITWNPPKESSTMLESWRGLKHTKPGCLWFNRGGMVSCALVGVGLSENPDRAPDTDEGNGRGKAKDKGGWWGNEPPAPEPPPGPFERTWSLDWNCCCCWLACCFCICCNWAIACWSCFVR